MQSKLSLYCGKCEMPESRHCGVLTVCDCISQYVLLLDSFLRRKYSSLCLQLATSCSSGTNAAHWTNTRIRRISVRPCHCPGRSATSKKWRTVDSCGKLPACALFGVCDQATCSLTVNRKQKLKLKTGLVNKTTNSTISDNAEGWHLSISQLFAAFCCRDAKRVNIIETTKHSDTAQRLSRPIRRSCLEHKMHGLCTAIMCFFFRFWLPPRQGPRPCWPCEEKGSDQRQEVSQAVKYCKSWEFIHKQWLDHQTKVAMKRAEASLQIFKSKRKDMVEFRCAPFSPPTSAWMPRPKPVNSRRTPSPKPEIDEMHKLASLFENRPMRSQVAN